MRVSSVFQKEPPRTRIMFQLKEIMVGTAVLEGMIEEAEDPLIEITETEGDKLLFVKYGIDADSVL